MIKTCAAIVIAAKHHELFKVKDARGTTNTVGALRCKFEFRTNDWDHTARTAMFCNGDAILHPDVIDNAIAVPLDEDDECSVPQEVLKDTLPYSIGVWGVTADGIRIVSRWLVFGAQLGCYTDGNAPEDPDPTIYEQILSNAKNAVDVANGVLDRANSGEFDGDSAYEVAKKLGYNGTEEEWIASLRGDQGVSIDDIIVNEDGDMIIYLSDGTYKNIGGVTINVDTDLSATSTNPVQNKIITEKINELDVKIDNLPQVDWLQEDETASDFIKNRTHYSSLMYSQNSIDYFEVSPIEKGVGIYPLVIAKEGQDGFDFKKFLSPEWLQETTASLSNAKEFIIELTMYIKMFKNTMTTDVTSMFLENIMFIDDTNYKSSINSSLGLEVYAIRDISTLTDEYKNTFLKNGVYLKVSKDQTTIPAGYGANVSFRVLEYFPLDEKYIPSTVAKASEVEDLEKRVDVLETTSGEPTFYITITDNGNGTYSADKTVEEIEAAYNKGSNILLVAPINQDPFSWQTESIYDTRNISVSRDEYDVLYIYGLFRLISYVSDTEVERYEVVLYNNGADELTVEYSKYIEIYASNSYVNDEISNVYVAMDSKITAPAIAEVGRVIAVKEVDESGKPTEWEAIDIPEQIQADWNQNDPTAPDYVKNRLAWTDDPVETVLLEETELTFVDGGAELPTPIQLTEGQTYVVTYNGNAYDCTAWLWEVEGIVFIGNGALVGESVENDKPFITNGALMMSINADASATIRIIEVAAEVHKIDEKYLPEQTHYDNRTMLLDYRGDGDYIELIFDPNGNEAFYYLTSDTFTVEELIGKRMDYIEFGERYSGTIMEEWIEDINGDGTLINVDGGTVIICNAENTVGNDVTFPYKGLYVMSPNYYGCDYSLQIYGGSYKQLDAKYLPDNVAYGMNEAIDIANEAIDIANEAQATAIIQPDWNQNDETSIDYIKNRTHYIEYNMREFSPTEYGAIAYNGSVRISNPDIVSAMNYDPNNVIAEYRYDTSSDWQTTTGYPISISDTDKRYYYRSLDGVYLFWYEFDTGYVYNNFINTSKDNLYIRFSGTVPEEHYVPLDARFIPDSIATVEQVETAQTTAENAQNVASEAYGIGSNLSNQKMEANNPIGKGTFRINNNIKDVYCINESTNNISIPQNATGQSIVKSGSIYTFNNENGMFTPHFYTTSGIQNVKEGLYYLPEGYETPSPILYRRTANGDSRGIGDIKLTAKLADNLVTIGNGTSDSARSNAHTLDWEGNAWYAGDVYVGSTSGTNRDEGSKKLATEEYVDASLTDKITTPATAAVGQVIAVTAVDGLGKPTEWGAVDFPSGGTAVSSIEPAEDDIPKVFFGGALQQTKDEAVVPFRYISKTEDISGYAEIKAQGNSSMSYPKKNQTVKLFKDAECTEKLKVDFKGWGKQNKFCFKANWIDLTHARNVVSARLWADVVKSRANYAELPELLRTTPNQGAMDGFPIKVYANGVYQGRYTLNIPKDKWAFNMDDNLDNHCALCGENYASGCFRASAQINESDWTDETHDTVPASIKTRWNEVISFVMNSTDDEFKANLGNYFYVDSLIDYYLFGLASCDLDGFGKNQMYLTYDGQKWIASLYDKDSTWGLYWNGSEFVASNYARTSYEDYVSKDSSGDGNLLYNRLEQLFDGNLKSRWAELKNGALSIENIINRFERFTDIASADLVKEDYASTTGGGKFTGIPSQSTNNIQQIRAYALARLMWTDEYVATLSGSEVEPDEPVVPNEPDDPVLLYSLPEATTFDGTNYIDTGVQLFAEDKPFTLMLDWEHTGESEFANSTHVIAHCMNENPPYPGLSFGYNINGLCAEIRLSTNLQVFSLTSDNMPNANLQRMCLVIKKDTDGKVTVVRRYNSDAEMYRSDANPGFSALQQTLLLGCYQTTNGTKGRFAKGIMNDCKVYAIALTDEEIESFLNG